MVFARRAAGLALAVSVVSGGPLQAQVKDAPAPACPDVEALRQEVGALRERLAALEALLAAPRPAPEAEAAAPAPEPPLPAPPPAGASKVFNPDMAMIGNFVAVGGKSPGSGEPSLALSEAEASFQAIVDPYARADFFLSFGAEGVNVEEGFVTFTSLPGDFLLKAGKLKEAFGKVNTLHSHVMPWADQPLVVANLLGGEGLADSGLSLSRLFVNPYVFLEATGEVYRGSNGVFDAPERADLSYLGRLRAYRDLGEDANLDVGGSLAWGRNNAGGRTRLIGVDATVRWRPLRQAYRRFLARTELMWSRREPGDPSSDATANAFGMYASAEYQIGRRWFAGARYDRSQRALDPSLTDEGGSFILTYWPSEFSQIRGQLRHTRFAEGRSANEALLQLLFSIGAHGAHSF